MGRLIDEDILIKNIKKYTDISKGYFENPDLLIQVIKNQPTTFDIEKLLTEATNYKRGVIIAATTCDVDEWADGRFRGTTDVYEMIKRAFNNGEEYYDLMRKLNLWWR